MILKKKTLNQMYKILNNMQIKMFKYFERRMKREILWMIDFEDNIFGVLILPVGQPSCRMGLLSEMGTPSTLMLLLWVVGSGSCGALMALYIIS